ncbi:unnamed protein product [Amoebophrya sp. A25]|nr:unnamed protein product [Amoebophrya sp. A25]|eukprot:GSA25T00027464001.1
MGKKKICIPPIEEASEQPLPQPKKRGRPKKEDLAENEAKKKKKMSLENKEQVTSRTTSSKNLSKKSSSSSGNIPQDKDKALPCLTNTRNEGKAAASTKGRKTKQKSTDLIEAKGSNAPTNKSSTIKAFRGGGPEKNEYEKNKVELPLKMNLLPDSHHGGSVFACEEAPEEKDDPDRDPIFDESMYALQYSAKDNTHISTKLQLNSSADLFDHDMMEKETQLDANIEYLLLGVQDENDENLDQGLLPCPMMVQNESTQPTNSVVELPRLLDEATHLQPLVSPTTSEASSTRVCDGDPLEDADNVAKDPENAIAFPWGAWNTIALPSGPEKTAGGHGYPTYMVTFSFPTSSMIKKFPNIAKPTDFTDEEWNQLVVDGHRINGVELKIVGIRREKGKKGKHIHLHAIVTAGNSRKRRNWKKTAIWLAEVKKVFTHYSSIGLAAGIHYLYYSSSRKHSAEFIGGMLMWYGSGVPHVPPQELADGSADSFAKTQMDFLEFRELIEQEDIIDILECQARTKENARLDQYLNNRAHDPSAIFKKALRSIAMRNFLPKPLYEVARNYHKSRRAACICEGRFRKAFRQFSKTVQIVGDEHKHLQGAENCISVILIVWMIRGRIRGNTLVFYGQEGTGKSWTMEAFKDILKEEFYEAPQPAGSYALQRLGMLLPPTRCFLLDELSRDGLTKLFGDKGYWKQFLQVQTTRLLRPAFPKNSTPDREIFDDPAPFWYTATRLVRLQCGDDGFDLEEHVVNENKQQQDRETGVRTTKKLHIAGSSAIPGCGYCLSQELDETGDDDDICWPCDVQPRKYKRL